MKVYLAGPMTGHPDHNFPMFEVMARRLREDGFEVVSPRELSGPTLEKALETPWEHHLRRDLAAMLGCDGVALLPGWATSLGATLEVDTARRVGLPVYYAEDLVKLGRPDHPDIATAALTGPELVQALERGRRVQNPARGHQTSHVPPMGGDEPYEHVDSIGERVADPRTGAVKADGGKARVDLLPTRPLEDVGDVLGFGAGKYAPWNWARGFDWSRPYGAALRHLFAWQRGEDRDPETGLSHLAHAACNLLFLLEYEHTGAGLDNRPGKETA